MTIGFKRVGNFAAQLKRALGGSAKPKPQGWVGARTPKKNLRGKLATIIGAGRGSVRKILSPAEQRAAMVDAIAAGEYREKNAALPAPALPDGRMFSDLFKDGEGQLKPKFTDPATRQALTSFSRAMAKAKMLTDFPPGSKELPASPRSVPGRYLAHAFGEGARRLDELTREAGAGLAVQQACELLTKQAAEMEARTLEALARA